MNRDIPEVYYKKEIQLLTATLARLKKRYALLGWCRLAAIVLLCFGAYKIWPNGWALVVTWSIALLALFLLLVSVALSVNKKIQHILLLIEANKNELPVLNGHYTHQANGESYIHDLKLNDNDLDLFGHASLFQYINRANGYHGKLALAKSFVQTPTLETIIEKQKAIQELSQQINWCKQLQAYSMIAPVSKKTEEIILNWLHDESEHFDKPIWQVLRYLVPVISFSTLILYISDLITDGTFNTIMILMLAFVFSFYKKITKQYSHISKIVPELNALLPALEWIEKKTFESTYLTQKKSTLLAQEETASKSIANLQSILKRFDYRLNPIVYLPLSAFLFWDLQQVLALEKWRKKQTAHLTKWFETLGDFEMLGSLATLTFNNPSWTFPVISEKWFELECKAIGHPLIKEEKMISNDFAMEGTPQVALITGSNMAGKSTFLRTIGINMVLAMAGGPVRAAYMKLPVGTIISSMRIMDNLEEETSTFYAELKKMKRIVEAIKQEEKVFILIDEMLRGTNTLDRHTGSVALTRQLIKHHAVGIIASHDLGLAVLEKEFPSALKNYHFDSSIIQEEIVFDYKLKNGVCESTNAYLLMKKIGIELQGQQ